MTNHQVLCQYVYLGRPPSLLLEEPNSLYYENSFVDVKKRKQDRKEKQNNCPGAVQSSYSGWEHERGFALT